MHLERKIKKKMRQYKARIKSTVGTSRGTEAEAVTEIN